MKGTINTFIDEINSSPPNKNYLTNKTVVTFIDDIWFSVIDDIWSSDLLDLVEFGPQTTRVKDIFW